MPAWAWVLIIVAAVVVLVVAVWRGLAARRSKSLRDRFGPEYDRTLETSESKRDAESELSARADRRSELEIRPLRTAARERYVAEWSRVQAQFVDDPDIAVHNADMLIQSVMRDRGYPMDDFEQRAADVSVDHPRVVEDYRQGHALARASAMGEGTTEDLRRAMQHYRSLFDELVEEASDAPLSRDDARAETAMRDDEAMRR
jgi:FtsZ-interacting cell division protein ZipA